MQAYVYFHVVFYARKGTFASSINWVVEIGLPLAEELAKNLLPSDVKPDSAHLEAKHFEMKVGLLSAVRLHVESRIEAILRKLGGTT